MDDRENYGCSYLSKPAQSKADTAGLGQNYFIVNLKLLLDNAYRSYILLSVNFYGFRADLFMILWSLGLLQTAID